jgi:hypothetical protein
MKAMLARGQRGSGLFRVFRRRDREAEMAAAFAVKEDQGVVVVTTVATGERFGVDLVHVVPHTPTNLRTAHSTDILCLDIHQFTVGGAIRWVHEAQAVELSASGFPRCIVVFGCVNRLTNEDLWLISRELREVGAVFHAWPTGCTSYWDAVRLYGQRMAETYGPADPFEDDFWSSDIVRPENQGETALSAAFAGV